MYSLVDADTFYLQKNAFSCSFYSTITFRWYKAMPLSEKQKKQFRSFRVRTGLQGILSFFTWPGMHRVSFINLIWLMPSELFV